MYPSTITSKGQVVIPKAVRDAMKLRPRQKVHVSPRIEGGRVVAVVEPVLDIMELAGKFKPRRKPVDPVKIRAYMEKHYERA